MSKKNTTLTTQKRMKNSGQVLYKILIYVMLILLAVTIIVPVAWVFLASLKTQQEMSGNPWVLPSGFYLENFKAAWQDAHMGEYIGNSVIVTALALCLLLVVALPAAYCLSRMKFRGRKILNLCFTAGLFINVSYIAVPIFLQLNDANNWVRGAFGLENIFTNNLVVLAIVYASTALPFTIYLLSGYFATLPHDFEEAAYIDGAGYGRTMLQIIFPMAKPSIITVILFNFLSFWNEFIVAMNLMTDKSKYTLPQGLVDLVTAGHAAQDLGKLYAGLVLAMLPVLILYICVQKKLTQGMTVGGLKVKVSGYD